MVSPKIDNDVDEEGAKSKAASEPGAVLIDDNAPDCEGFYCERVMISAYKALNFMSLGDYDSAKTELNRALIGRRSYDRTSRSRARHAENELSKAHAK